MSADRIDGHEVAISAVVEGDHSKAAYIKIDADLPTEAGHV